MLPHIRLIGHPAGALDDEAEEEIGRAVVAHRLARRKVERLRSDKGDDRIPSERPHAQRTELGDLRVAIDSRGVIKEATEGDMPPLCAETRHILSELVVERELAM